MLRLRLLLNASRSVPASRGDRATGDVTGSLDRRLLYVNACLPCRCASAVCGVGPGLTGSFVLLVRQSMASVRARLIVVDLACSTPVSSIRGIFGGILLFNIVLGFWPQFLTDLTRAYVMDTEKN